MIHDETKETFSLFSTGLSTGFFPFGGLVRTLSIKPNSWASVGLIKLSRSILRSIFVNSNPVCLTYSKFICFFSFKISSA